jgi:hypothetical protein
MLGRGWVDVLMAEAGASALDDPHRADDDQQDGEDREDQDVPPHGAEG